MEHDREIRKLLLTFQNEWFEERKEQFAKHPNFDNQKNAITTLFTYWSEKDNEPLDHYTHYSFTDFCWDPDTSNEQGDGYWNESVVLSKNCGLTTFRKIETIIGNGIAIIKDETPVAKFVLDRISEIEINKRHALANKFIKERDLIINKGIDYLERSFSKELQFTGTISSKLDNYIKFNKNQVTIIRLLYLLYESGYFKDEFIDIKHYACAHFLVKDSDGEFKEINFNKFRDEELKMKQGHYKPFLKDIVNSLDNSITNLIK